MSQTPIELNLDTAELTEPVEPFMPTQQHHVNLPKLPEALLDNPNIADCVSAMPHQPDVCIHDIDNCNQPTRQTVQTPQMN